MLILPGCAYEQPSTLGADGKRKIRRYLVDAFICREDGGIDRDLRRVLGDFVRRIRQMKSELISCICRIG